MQTFSWIGWWMLGDFVANSWTVDASSEFGGEAAPCEVAEPSGYPLQSIQEELGTTRRSRALEELYFAMGCSHWTRI